MREEIGAEEENKTQEEGWNDFGIDNNTNRKTEGEHETQD